MSENIPNEESGSAGQNHETRNQLGVFGGPMKCRTIRRFPVWESPSWYFFPIYIPEFFLESGDSHGDSLQNEADGNLRFGIFFRGNLRGNLRNIAKCRTLLTM